MWLVLLVGLLLYGLASLSEATTYYATASGGGGSCSAAQTANPPIQSLQAGIGCLSSGDTLVLKCGTYNERIGNNVPNGSLGNPTTITSESVRCATLAPTGAGQGGNIIFLSQADTNHDITIDGLTVDMGPQTCPAGLGFGSGVVLWGNHMQLLNSEIKNMCGPASDQGSNGVSLGADTLLPGYAYTGRMAGNSIHDLAFGYNEQTEIRSMGFYVGGSAPTIIENNDFYNIGGYCGELWSARQKPNGDPATNNLSIVRNNLCHSTGLIGIHYSSGTNGKIYNNVIWDFNRDTYTNEFGLSVGGVGWATNNMEVYNNTIFGGRTTCLAIRSGAEHTVRNNVCWGNGQDSIYNPGASFTSSNNLCQGVGCSVYVNPQFANPGAGDFHLTSGSPEQVKTGGDNLSSTFTTDKDGSPRSVPWSLGAYEFGGAGLPAPTNLRLISITP